MFVPEYWMNGTHSPGGLIVGRADYTEWTGSVDHKSQPDNGLNVDPEVGTHKGTSRRGTSEPAYSTIVEPRTSFDSNDSTGAFGVATSSADDAATRFVIPPVEPGVYYIVTGFTMGERADRLLRQPQPTIIARFLSQLDRTFGMDATGAFLSGFVADWSKEPWIHGAYSTPTSYEDARGAAILAEPHADGAVLFAGEATAGAVDGSLREDPSHALHYASPIVLHGAMNTGAAAACDCARSLGIPVICLEEEQMPANSAGSSLIPHVSKPHPGSKLHSHYHPHGRFSCRTLHERSQPQSGTPVVTKVTDASYTTTVKP
jgi:hypothetical protein